jgi:serine/threonine protein kinase
MEQACYDFKADIWSLGITCMELANGHAPLAKYPPIKVLMLTLSNDPPSLDRESTRHKYSKSFKDLIDLCLQKDPTRRPTSEKLLGHPFFKSSKKKQWLVTNLLADLPPLSDRVRRRASTLPTHGTRASGNHVSWDFDLRDSQLSSSNELMGLGIEGKPTTEVKKGRFSVQSDQLEGTTSPGSISPSTSMAPSPQLDAPTQQRKGRFQVSVGETGPEGTASPTPASMARTTSGTTRTLGQRDMELLIRRHDETYRMVCWVAEKLAVRYVAIGL